MIKKAGIILGGFIILLIVYLFLIFPMLDKNLNPEAANINTNLWKKSGFDSLTHYYIEYERIPQLDLLLSNIPDSTFVVNFKKRNRNTRTLKNPEQYIFPFTNNFTSSTLYSYSAYLDTDNKEYLDVFLKSAEWMINNVRIFSDSVALWTNDNMIYDKYNLKYGWASSYAQGFGLSVLCRAYQYSSDQRYIDIAGAVLNSFNLHYQNGGIMDIDSADHFWYLEYPADPPAYVLNGMIFGLFGIYDYCRITKSEKAKLYFDRGIETLKINLSRYDMGYWSSYDLLYNHFCAGYNYHKNIHISQLKILYQLSGEKIFEEYATRFTRYLQEPYNSIFKINFTIDAIQRRFSYKSPFRYRNKKRFQ